MSLLWMSQRNANAGRSLPEIFKSSFAMFCRFWGTNYTHTHTHTHTHTCTHTRWRNGRWKLQIYQPAIQKRGISIWQQTHVSFSIALFLQINILKAWYEWKESATFFCEARNLIKNVSDLHRKLIFFWLPNDEPSLCNEHVPGESILYILRERRWDRLDGWTWFVCIFSISPFMDTLWTLYSHVQS